MLRSVKDLEGYAIYATDGDVGFAKDFHFDDEAWVIRYLVVETSDWMASRRVLISAAALGRPNDVEQEIPVAITRQQVENSPDLDTQGPLTRQQEMFLLTHYGYLPYWQDTSLHGDDTHPEVAMPEFSSTPSVIAPRLDEPPSLEELLPRANEGPHVRAFNDVIGTHVETGDGGIGTLRGLLVDESTWAVRYLVVDGGDGRPDRDVVIAPQWIDRAEWPDRLVASGLTRDAVRAAPPFDPATDLDRHAEEALWTHYGRAGYWKDETVRAPGEAAP